MINSLIMIAIAIISLLSGYAIYLQIKLKKHKTEQARMEAQANAKLVEFQQALIKDIQFIALAMLQKQCDITEGVLRIQHLIQRLDNQLWHKPELEQTKQYHEKCASMPILEEYKQQTKQQKMQQDLERIKLESEYKEKIIAEMNWLKNYDFKQILNNKTN